MLCIYYIIFSKHLQDFCAKSPHVSFYRLFIHNFSNLHKFMGKCMKKTPFSRRFLRKIDVFYYFDLRLREGLLELPSGASFFILFSRVLYLYSGKTSFVSLVFVAYASSRSASTSSFASSAITSSSFGWVLGCLGVNTVQQSS